MDKGYLVVSVYHDTVAEPVEGATVTVRGDNYEQSFSTDNSGKTPTIELEAPLKIYSLTPQTEVRPYSVYQVEVNKAGYETTIINGVQILPDETSLQNVFLSSIPAVTTMQKTMLKRVPITVIDIPNNELWDVAQGTSEGKPEDTEEPQKIETEDRVFPEILIPEYVIVHNGAPTNTSATNNYVTFTDYIKNVASGEIYSTWPVEAIRANVYAILSFTMSRIYSEWYRSQGRSFTITSLPQYDQTYAYNRTIFQKIADVVDDIFLYHIQLPGRNYPFFAQYNDGIKVNNAGWLSQWGSKSLADQGYTALQILKYYYVNTLTLHSAQEIEGLPLSFPGYNLELGACGEAVQKMQIMLNTISGNYPAIPKINPTDGQYKESTVASVKKFQQVFSIPTTGIADFATWYRISYIYIAVSKMLQGVSK
ncbi:MAG: peptidoglycan-binding protein [Bacilli bacterium]|nr:peptidoglycan-binding protein [Bacilli bacterium]